MKKIIAVPDSFKGTMSSAEICGILEKTVHRYYPDCRVVKIPVADGGEGTVEAYLAAAGGKIIRKTVKGPLYDDTEAFYGILDDGRTAVIEMAAASGLTLTEGRPDAAAAASYGTGELIADAAKRGCTDIVLGLGGSACTDGGTGIVAALGVRFFDCSGAELKPCGKSLLQISSVDVTEFEEKYGKLKITVICDVTNPLCGIDGAAYVFGPQKGADEETAEMLDLGLAHLNDLLTAYTGKDRRNIPGMGAAGGSCLCLDAFLSADIRSGIDYMLDLTGFDRELEDADFVFTGEGKMDSQSIYGKVLSGVAARARKKGVPVIAIAGDIDDGALELYNKGVTAVFSTNRAAVPFSTARKTAAEDFEMLVDALMRYSLCFKGV